MLQPSSKSAIGELQTSPALQQHASRVGWALPLPWLLPNGLAPGCAQCAQLAVVSSFDPLHSYQRCGCCNHAHQPFLLQSQCLLSLTAPLANCSSHELGCLPQLPCLAAAYSFLLRLPALDSSRACDAVLDTQHEGAHAGQSQPWPLSQHGQIVQ